MSAHTPGPWKVVSRVVNGRATAFRVVDSAGLIITDADKRSPSPGETV